MKTGVVVAVSVLLATLSCGAASVAAQPAPSVSGKAVRVVPCPHAVVDSAAAITDALLAIPPGGTVWLEACTYYIGRPVEVTVPFRGSLRGAGMSKTVITTLPAGATGWEGSFDVLMPNWVTQLDTPGTPGPTLGPSLFHFLAPEDTSSSVLMSDFTIDVTDPVPAPASARAGWFAGSLLAFVTLEGQAFDSAFEAVAMRGAFNPNYGMENSIYGIEVWGELSHWGIDEASEKPMVGSHSVRGCRFEGIGVPYNPGFMMRSQVAVIQNSFVAKLPWDIGIFAVSLEDSDVKIIDNEFELGGLATWGISVGRNDGGTEQVPPRSLVSGNRFKGWGDLGILLWTGANSRVLNNDLDGFTAAVSPIELGLFTSDTLVVGAAPGSVHDLGTNNRIQKQ